MAVYGGSLEAANQSAGGLDLFLVRYNMGLEMEAKLNSEGSDPIIEISDLARDHIQRLMQRENKAEAFLRVSVVSGGCSGMSYKLSFEAEAGDSDILFEENGLKVLVDRKSSLFLKGIVVDYTDGLDGAGFTYENPNAKRSCGCGTSFNV